jgi:hypothetical protein
MTDYQPLGEQQAESVIDDFQSMDLDINSLVTRFIKPIDQIRSKNAPIVTGNSIQQLTNSQTPQESRAHAFYRLMGLPAIASDGRFYNTGFNPKIDSVKNDDIVKNIPDNVRQMIAKRETDYRTRISKFYNYTVDTSVYGLVLADPDGQRQFMVMDLNKDGLSDGDLQNIEIPHRREFITKNYVRSDGSQITNTFNSISHILRPFITDPIISANVEPKSGSNTAMIGVPFLLTSDAEFEYNTYVKRPGIEFILRLRLRQQNAAEQTGIIFNQVDLKSFEGEVSNKNQREIAAALTNVGVSDVDVDQALDGASLVELYTLNDLVKTFKGLIYLYRQSIENVESARKKIIWVPLSNKGGPETGTEVMTTFVVPKGFLGTWSLEQRIRQLEVKSSLAKSQLEIGDDLSFSDFAISEFSNLANAFDGNLQEAINERSRLEAEASNALRIIEYISGEVSGLGLIDIFAIYMAMWAVPVNVLLDLIDDSAAKRLDQIKELHTADVTARASKYGNAKEAYNKLEKQIISILSYADRLYIQAKGHEEDSSDIERA